MGRRSPATSGIGRLTERFDCQAQKWNEALFNYNLPEIEKHGTAMRKGWQMLNRVAGQIGIRALNWDTVYGVSAKEDLKPAQAEAMHELRRILRHTNKVGRAILIAVCGEGRAVRDFERQAGWRDCYGIERLREALDDVAECRGLITRRLAP